MRALRHPLRTRSATILIVLVAAITFGFDLSQPLGVAGGIPYVILPMLGLLARSPVRVVAAAVLGTLLTGAGLLLSSAGASHDIALANRAMSAVLIWVVATMCLHHLRADNRWRERLRLQAMTDPLTGLYNRRHMFSRIRAEMSRYDRYGHRFAVILIDADHFKLINDSHGHIVGDATLSWIAATCRTKVRESDVVGRFGGEEFIILLPHTTATEAQAVAERIRHAMHEPIGAAHEAAVRVTLSLGVAEIGPQSATFDDLLKSADEALYEAKRAGRDRVAVKTSAAHEPETNAA